ncbi:MAG: radical SAM protein [Cyanobacteria bacterium P01_H01_bin.74]
MGSSNVSRPSKADASFKISELTKSLPLLSVDPTESNLPEKALFQYPAVTVRKPYEPLEAKKNRALLKPVVQGMVKQSLNLTPDPVMLTHIVTTRCNYSCGFCSFADTLNAKTNELGLDEIKKTYASIGNNLNVIVYSGGETTLNRNLAEIIEAAYTLTPVQSVYIISNAWKPNLLLEITHRIMQTCPDLHLTWSLSIEGPKAVNNATRYTKASNWDAWQNTIDAMQGLKAIRHRFGYKQLDVQLCTVCTPDNAAILEDWYHQVRDELKPDKWNLNLMRKSVQMSEHTMETFDARRQKKSLEPFETKYLAITEAVRQDVLAGTLKFLYHTPNPGDGAMKSAVDLISQQENRNTLLENPLRFQCKAGSMGAYISSNGLVSGCEEFAHHPGDPKVFGQLRDNDYNFMAIWRSKTAKKLRQLAGKSPECRGCTLESQRNYPSALLSPKTLLEAGSLAKIIAKS